MSEGPKIHIDSDWKAEAQREKEKLSQQSKAKAEAAAASASASTGAGAQGAQGAAAGGGQAPGGSRELPPATFETLMAQLATQALMYMGGYADPRTGQPMVQLDVARHHIDMLGVLEDKTQGNLSDEERRALTSTLYELRSRYVQAANAARQK